jgi:hypothetical protein
MWICGHGQRQTGDLRSAFCAERVVLWAFSLAQSAFSMLVVSEKKGAEVLTPSLG